MNPKVSVIIPTYNCAEYLPQAIESILAQTYKDYEIIVVDDGSSDGTDAVLAKYGDKIRCLRQENQGPGAARNSGIRNSRGTLVAILDADDKWFPQKLEIQCEYMASHEEIGLVFSDANSFDENGTKTVAYNRNYRRVFEGQVFDKLILKNFIGSNTIMVRKECLDEVGLFAENTMVAEDWHLWLRIAKRYFIGYIDQPLVMYRLSPGTLTANSAKAYPYRIQVMEEILSLYSDYFECRTWLVRRARGGVLMRYGYSLFDAGDYPEARRKLVMSVRHNPLQLKAYIYLLGLLVPKGLKGHISRLKARLGIAFMPAE